MKRAWRHRTATLGLAALAGLAVAHWNAEYSEASTHSVARVMQVAEELPDSAFRVQWLSWRVSPVMQAGRVHEGMVAFRNLTGRTLPYQPTGPDDAGMVRISYHWYAGDRDDLLVHDGRRTHLPRDVSPESIMQIESVQILAPAEPGRHRLQLTIVQERVAWFEARGAETVVLPITVQ